MTMPNKPNCPMPLDVQEGRTYGWCSCGLSLAMPLCDGTHRELAPDKKSVKFIAEETKRIYLCGCCQTQTPPFCDKSHLKLP
jgi:CDGSH-type Zn-finger protein